MPATPNRFQEFDPAVERALLGRQSVRWERDKGATLRLHSKNGPPKLIMGGEGKWTWNKLGIGLLILLGVDAATHALTGKGVNMAAFIALSSVAYGIGPALAGSPMAWRNARANGAGRLSAFSAMCRRSGHSLLHRAVPNLAHIPLAALGIPLLGVEFIHGKTDPNGKAHAIAGALLVRAKPAASAAHRGIESFARWQAGHAVEAARLDGRSAAQAQIYDEIADARASDRWQRADGEMPSPFGALEQELRDRFFRMLKEAWNTRLGLADALDRFDAAGGEPWHRPSPELPTIAKLAAALNRQLDATEDPDEAMATRIDAMAARVEAWEIKGSIGEASLDRLAQPAAKRRL